MLHIRKIKHILFSFLLTGKPGYFQYSTFFPKCKPAFTS